MTKDNETTRDRLLDSADAVFTARGYRDATVAEICEGADANVAAVNYHFGDKRSLYDAVWRRAMEASRGAFPLPDPEHGNPADLLRQAVHALLGRALEPGAAGHMARLQLREMAEPTDALADIVRESVVPTRRALLRIVSRVLGDRVPAQTAELCTMSLASQIIFLSFSAPVRRQLVAQRQYNDVAPDRYAEHIVTYNLAALRAVRRAAGRAAR